MPYYTSPLLSLLPQHMTSTYAASHRRVPIDSNILKSAKTVDFVGYATYPPHLRSAARRNQVRTLQNSKIAGRLGVDAPMFRSERERADAKRRRDYGDSVSDLALRSRYAQLILMNRRRRRRTSRRKRTTPRTRCRNTTARSRSSTAVSVSKTLTSGAWPIALARLDSG